MTSLVLKQYQQNALAALADFLRAARAKPVAQAFAEALAAQERGDAYQPVLGDTPSVCLRIPTGGGKTLLAAHAVALAGQAVLDSDAPVALWLTPSDAIRAQTLEGLRRARHPYRQALEAHFGDGVKVCDLESLQTIGTQDVGKACIVVVATIQSFNVTETATRNVYSFFEELQPHFEHLPSNVTEGMDRVTAEDVLKQPFLTARDIGRVKWSVANWLHRQRPIVIVDEAHNNRTDRFFKSLRRLNPSCVVELTATPVPGNNVLYRVAAAELKAEEMIKLPIVLAEHPDGWQACLRDAHLARVQLETIAQKEPDYVRPIALIQAAPKGSEATVDVVRQYLLKELLIPEAQIAVATGAQKELDGIDLFDPACPVRYVITVEALKEGWDCSFAYVLASVQSVKSAKDVEQLLGRVLRMPYAKTRQQEALNKAYAHIVASDFAEAAANLKDRMVQNMGFEPLEASGLLLPPPQLPLGLSGGAGGAESASPRTPDCHIELAQAPDTTHWPDEVKRVVQIRPTSQGATALIAGNVDAPTLAQAESFIAQSVPPKQREAIHEQFAGHRAMRRALTAPAQLGETFAPVPQLCLEIEGHFELVEREMLSDLAEWDLLKTPVQLAGFALHETLHAFEIDMKGEHVTYRHTDAQQLDLDAVETATTEQDLVRWLDGATRQPDILQAQLRAYLVKMVAYLVHERHFKLTGLVRTRHALARAISAEIDRLRQNAVAQGFQAQLPYMRVAPPTERLAPYSFAFQPGQYPARPDKVYRGSFEFKKHFYPVINDLREKTETGAAAEEFICAQAIDVHPKVKYWVRNIDQQEKFSFWLPTATDRFYPDFVAELTDGRVLVVEYKGQHLADTADSREKKQIGDQWAKSSDGRCLFLFAVWRDEAGRAVAKQIDDTIERA